MRMANFRIGRWLVLLLGLSFAPLLFAGELDLTVPSAPVKAKPQQIGNAPCKGCGVVTSIRQLPPAPPKDLPPPPTYLITFAEAKRQSAGNNVDVGGFHVNTVKDPYTDGNWQITVRYDNGAYAVFEQRDQLSLQKGDHVQVVAGKVVPR